MLTLYYKKRKYLFVLCNVIQITQDQWIILNIAIISSILLMSNVNYDKFPLISFKINRRNTFDLIRVILFLVILFLSLYFYYYDLVLLLFIMLYIFGNLIKYICNKLLNKK